MTTTPGSGATVLRPVVDMPSYGRLNGLMRRGTMARYGLEIDRAAGTITWRNDGKPPITLGLPGSAGPAPVLREVVVCRYATWLPVGTAGGGLVADPGRAVLMLVGEDGRCRARTFQYLDDRLVEQWQPVLDELQTMGIAVRVEQRKSPRQVHQAYPGALRNWIWFTGGWNLIPILGIVLFLVVLGVILISIFDTHDPGASGAALLTFAPRR